MKNQLQISIFRTALSVFLLTGLFSISDTAYGQANAIRSNYIKLTGGGGTTIEYVGDPTGSGVLPHTDNACCGQFRYNFGTNNKFLIFTGMPVANVPDPDQTVLDNFRVPTMVQLRPDYPPSATAFTVLNVTDSAEISLIDQSAPSVIYANETETFYTNSPFTSETRVYNGTTTATMLSGKVRIKIPKAQLCVEPSMLEGPNAWVKYDEESNYQYDYYDYALPQLAPFQTHTLNPPIALFVLPQCISVNTQYWLVLEDIMLSSPANISDPVEKNLSIPNLLCFFDGACGGTGTAEDPYQICTIEGLADLVIYVNFVGSTDGVYFKLMNDLDAAEFLSPAGEGYNDGAGWRPVGNELSSFNGYFDGNNKVIRNITINRPNQDYIGLFGNTSTTIQNIGVENCNITGNNHVGGLTGSGSVSNSYVTGNIIGNNYVGGLTGFSRDISNSYVIGNITGKSYIGGLAGASENISNSYATGNIIGNNYVGGLVGVNTGTIRNSIAVNNSIIAPSTTSNVNRICGISYSYGVFQNNHALSTMTVRNAYGDVNITDGSNEAGTGKPLATFHHFDFYHTANNWHDAAWSIANPNGIWKICDGEGLPFLRWQNIACDSVSVIENKFAEAIIYSHQNTVYIKTVGALRATSLPTVQIFDMTGRMVYQNILTNNETAITLSVATGIYAVKMVSQDGEMAVRKVFIMK